MRVLHGEGFKNKEREEARDTIVSNLVITVYLIISQMDLHKTEDEDSRELKALSRNLLSLLSASEEMEISQYIYELDTHEGSFYAFVLFRFHDTLLGDEEYSPDETVTKTELLRKIWTNFKFRDSLGGLTLYKLPDSALYFLSHFERILSGDFVPLSDDIIICDCPQRTRSQPAWRNTS